MEPAIVPICIYRTDSGSDMILSLPFQEENGNLTCFQKPVYSLYSENTQELTLAGQFYALNPDIRPIPPGSVLFCSNPNIFEPIYDPFDIDRGCLRFIAWLNRAPHTVPLYVSKGTAGFHISLSPETPEGYTPLYFSPIHVLSSPDMKFSGYQGMCIPDPNGTSIGECLVLNVKKVTGNAYEPTLINYLREKHGNSLNWGLLLIFLCLSLIFLKRFLF